MALPLLGLGVGGCDYLFHEGLWENLGLLIFERVGVGSHHNYDALLGIETELNQLIALHVGDSAPLVETIINQQFNPLHGHMIAELVHKALHSLLLLSLHPSPHRYELILNNPNITQAI